MDKEFRQWVKNVKNNLDKKISLDELVSDEDGSDGHFTVVYYRTDKFYGCIEVLRTGFIYMQILNFDTGEDVFHDVLTLEDDFKDFDTIFEEYFKILSD